MSDVFISYRRGASSPYARGIYERLEERFGHDRVFMDIDTMEPGVDFVDYIKTAVGSCRVLIVVISPDWVSAVDDTGQRRLDDPEDFVRVEVTAALERDDVRVIPVLVGDAPPPKKADLPAELAPLTRRQALEVTDGRWDYDLSVLVKTITRVFADDEPVRRDTEITPSAPPNADQQPTEAVPRSKWEKTVAEPPHKESSPEASFQEQRSASVPIWRRPLVLGGAAVLLLAVLLLALLAGGEESNAPGSDGAPSLTAQEMDEALQEFRGAFAAKDAAALESLAARADYLYLSKKITFDYYELFKDLAPVDVEIRIVSRSLNGPSGVARIAYAYVNTAHKPRAQCQEGWMHGGTARVTVRDFAQGRAKANVKITEVVDRPYLNWETGNRSARTQSFRVFSDDRDAPISSLQEKQIERGSHCVLLRLNSNADGLGPEQLVRVAGVLQTGSAERTRWGPQPGRLQRGLG